MINLIDELKVIPGVMGACVVDSREGLKATNLPTIFKPERLQLVGNHLLKLCAAGQTSFDDLSDITINFDESVVVARRLDKEKVVFAVCDQTFNSNLLKMSFSVLQDEFNDNYSAAAPAAPTPVAEPAAPVQKVKSKALVGLLGEMEQQLGKIVGPMAEFIFAETVEEWESQGDVSDDKIDTLLDLLDQELGGEDKVERYHELIAPALNSFQKG